MTAGILRKELAPLSPKAWEQIEDEANRWLKTFLSARTLVDFAGPHGWEYAAVNLGRVDLAGNKATPGVGWGQRAVLPLIEVRAPFTLNQFEIDNITRGAADADLAPLAEAAREFALFEDRLVYQGFPDAGMQGIVETATHEPIPLPKDAAEYPEAIAKGLGAMHAAGIGGPYALVLEENLYHKLLKIMNYGKPVYQMLSDLVGGKLVWSAGLAGGVLLSLRGGDFELHVGQDVSMGYAGHNKENVELYLTESLAFRIPEPAAAVVYTAK
ncbi:MAG: family 1 encapsulin nanocompartment shell protein [Candidatus Hydrogenedentota bacterium]